MTFVVIARDKGDGTLRRQHRAAHLEYVAGQQDKLVYGGPLIEDGRMIGSLFVFALETRAELDEYCALDPYFTAPIFETIEIFKSRWMVPERETGFLAAEARKARGEVE
jgi:uncharacterized protein YciI